MAHHDDHEHGQERAGPQMNYKPVGGSAAAHACGGQGCGGQGSCGGKKAGHGHGGGCAGKHDHAHDHEHDHDHDHDHGHAPAHAHDHEDEHVHGIACAGIHVFAEQHKHDGHDHGDHDHDDHAGHDHGAHAGHGHGHGHGHHHHHHGDPANHGRAFAIAVVLNAVFVVAEFGFGFVANSTALMADAGHNLSDVLGLLLAWGAVILSRRAPDKRYTYGLRSTSILAALGNAMFLLVACGAIAWEAVQRFSHQPEVAGLTVTLVAAAGIAINGFSAWLFMKDSEGDLNIRGAYLHMAADAAISLGVVIAGVLMMWTGWYWLDAVMSLAIVALIVMGTWGLLRESVQLALSAVPANIDAAAVERYLRQRPGVVDIHDLHIWGMSTTESAMTVHLVTPDGYPGDAFMDDITQTMKKRFSIHHCTLQVEQGTTDHACTLHAGPGTSAH